MMAFNQLNMVAELTLSGAWVLVGGFHGYLALWDLRQGFTGLT